MMQKQISSQFLDLDSGEFKKVYSTSGIYVLLPEAALHQLRREFSARLEALAERTEALELILEELKKMLVGRK